ncbi:hypothetical protein [Pseudomonas sp. S3_C01]
MPPNAAIKPMPAAAALPDSNLLGNRQNGAIEEKQAAQAIAKAAMISTGEGSASTTPMDTAHTTGAARYARPRCLTFRCRVRAAACSPQRNRREWR